MSDNLTPKQEKFLNHYLQHGNATEAYRHAYKTNGMNEASIGREAHSLLKNPKIAPRLLSMQRKASEEAVLSRAWVLEKLMQNAKDAHKLEDFTASNKALELLGKTDELSMFVERKQVESDNRHHHSAEPVSAFDEFLAGVAGKSSEGTPEDTVPN